LKIILIGPSSPLRGGIANFNDSLYSVLAKDHEVRIISFSLQYPSVLFPGKSQYEQDDPGGLQGTSRVINSINPVSWFRASEEIVKMKPDCIIVHYWMPFFAPAFGTIIRLVKRQLDVNVIGLLHNVNPHEKMIAGKSLTAYFLAPCDGFITLSSTVRAELGKTGTGKPVRVIPHPVYEIFGSDVSRSTALANLNLDPAQHHLLFFGIIRPYKGLDLLLRSFANNRISHLNLKLIVAGEFYGNRKKYLGLTAELGLMDKVKYTDAFVPKDRVGDYFAVSDLVVLPYLSATQSGIIQIAYNFGKPVVVTNVGGLREVVEHGKTGYICEKDPELLAAAIADFFNNNRSPEFAGNIKRLKHSFSWDAMAEGVLALYAELSGLPGK
jgi:glycosyltransferase involved in cell wall biosynthesis